MKKVIFLAAVLGLCLGLLCIPAGAVTNLEEWPEALRNGKTKQLFGAYSNYFILQEDGSLWAWGAPFFEKEATGENGEPMWQGRPVQIMTDVIFAEDTLGGGFMVVKQDGSVWRHNRNGKMEKCLDAGTGAVSAIHSKYGENTDLQEALEKGIRMAIFVLKENGDLSAYPYYDGAEKSAPEQEVPILKDVVKIYGTLGGCNTIFALKKDGSLWTWGDYGMQGGLCTSNDDPTVMTPKKLMDDVKDITVSPKNIVWAVKTDGTLWGWGSMLYGREESPRRFDIEGVRKIHAFDLFVFLPDVAILENGGFAVMDTDGKWLVAKDVRALQELAVSQKERILGAPAVLLDANGCIWTLDMDYVNSSIDDRNFTPKDFGFPTYSQLVQLTGMGTNTTAPATHVVTAANMAYASTQMVQVDGKPVEFQMYALKDANGSPTNYIKIRDLASVLNGTKAQFGVGYDGAVNLLPSEGYTPNGSEMQTPYSGDRAYTMPKAATNINGKASDLAAILLTSDSGGGFTYYKLRDLGKALNFNVGWSKEKGVFIETDKPYTE